MSDYGGLCQKQCPAAICVDSDGNEVKGEPNMTCGSQCTRNAGHCDDGDGHKCGRGDGHDWKCDPGD